MNETIRKYADVGDLRSLKFVFADALDVDPTFVKYEEEFAYCKSRGLLESHIELTPFVLDTAAWNEDYWVKLKNDLNKNFSEQRMEHMKAVAQIYHADKIRSLLEERAQAEKAAKEPQAAVAEPRPEKPATRPVPDAAVKPVTANPASGISKQEAQARRVAEEKAALDQKNAEFEAKKRAEEQRRRQTEESLKAENKKSEDGLSKKAVGIAAAVAAVAVVAVVVVLVLK